MTHDPDCGPGKLFAPSRSIRLRTEIPGPKSCAFFERLKTASALPTEPIVVEKAHGALVYDVDGNVFIDFASGTIEGHTPEYAVASFQEQAEKVTHVSESIGITEDYLRLCELLNEITPEMGGPKKTLLFSDLQQAKTTVETIVKAFTGRDNIKETYDWSRVDFNTIQFHAAKLRDNRTLFWDTEAPNDLARTGRLFAVENIGICPDLMTLSIGGVSALTGRAEIIDTYHKLNDVQSDALRYAAAIRTIQQIREQNLPGRAVQIGALIHERYSDWQHDLPFLKALHGIGALLTFEVENTRQADQIVHRALKQGLLLTRQPSVPLIPLLFPLMIPEEQLNEGLDVLETVFRDILPDD